jgi:hypothetical protein
VDHVLALRFERPGTLEDFERGLDPNPRHSFGDLHLSIIGHGGYRITGWWIVGGGWWPELVGGTKRGLGHGDEDMA